MLNASINILTVDSSCIADVRGGGVQTVVLSIRGEILSFSCCINAKICRFKCCTKEKYMKTM